MDQADIERIVAGSLTQLYAEELEILRADIGERTICGSLAAILRPHFPEHRVHIEYNRHGVVPKDIELPDGQGNPQTRRVYPDIIVHQPGHDRENILVIEIKKSTNAVDDYADLTKLHQIKLQMRYRFALFLRLPAGPAAALEDVHDRWVE